MSAHQTVSSVLSMMLFAGFLCSEAPAYSRSMDDKQQKKTARNGYVFLPFLSYSPETKLSGGVVLNYYFRASEAGAQSKPSNVMPSVMVTQKQQISLEIPVHLYWQDELYYLSGYIGYAKFPDRFYGIGHDAEEENEENYTPRIFQIRSNFQRKISADTYAGIQYNLKYHKILTLEDGGLLEDSEIAGSGAGKASGLGVSLTRDTRNSVFYPTMGTLLTILVQRFDGLIDSDYDFSRMSADIRAYAETFRSHVIAVNGYVNYMTGTPPFHLLSLLGQVGERNVMRGYYRGRYRDLNIFVLQMEYRMPLWWRFGFAAFGGIGDVSHHLSEFSLSRLKYTFGLGFRFQLNRQENINLRLDFGFGKESSGLYLTIGEAF